MKKIAVVLPNGWKGGMFRSAKEFCRLILTLGPEYGGPFEVVLGIVRNAYDESDLDDIVGTERWSVREVGWERLTEEDAAIKFGIARTGIQDRVRPIDYGGYDLLDCDAWFLHGIPSGGVMAPIRPYAVFCADFLQRVVPEIYGDAAWDSPMWRDNTHRLLTTRYASIAYATTAQTLEDVVGYVGVPRARARIAPIFFEDFSTTLDDPGSAAERDYFVWTTNPTYHKNHLVVLDALDTYYSQHNGSLDVIVTGAGTEVLNPAYAGTQDHPYWKLLRDKISGYSWAPERIEFAGNLRDVPYRRTLSQGKFLLHCAIYDNETASALEAGAFGRATVSADYPQMREVAETFGLNVMFFPPRNASIAAEVFKRAEIASLGGAFTGRVMKPVDFEDRLKTCYGGLVKELLYCGEH